MVSPPPKTSTAPYDHGEGHNMRRGHGQHLSISDESHHVTEAIGYMYDDDYDQRNSRHLSFVPSPTNDIISVAPQSRDIRSSSSPSDSSRQPENLAIRTASLDPSHAQNGKHRETSAESGSAVADRESGGQSSPTSRTSPVDAPKEPVKDIDYKSDPASVAQELSNLAALRRMSMDIGSTDPDLPAFGSGFRRPSVEDSDSDSAETDNSKLFWVPAHLHPGIAPDNFKSFIENKERKSEEFTPSNSGSQLQISGGSLRRKKSMLSRQVDPSSRSDGSDSTTKSDRRRSNTLGSVREEPSSRTGLALQASDDQNDLMLEDKPILPPAPPGNSLRRSTRTTYRKGSLKRGDRIYGRRLPKQADADAESLSRRSSTPSEDPPILGLTRVSTDPTPGNAGGANYSRPARTKPSSIDTGIPSEPLVEKTSPTNNRASAPSQVQPWRSQISSSGRSSLDDPAATQTAEGSSAGEKQLATKTPPSQKPTIPERRSHESTPSLPPQTTSPPEPAKSSRRAGFTRTAKEPAQTFSEIASHPSPLPGNTTRTDSLSVIPTILEEPKKAEPKKSKDKKDSEGGRKSSWHWLRGTEEKEKDRKKDDDGKKNGRKASKGSDKSQDGTRLDVLQTSIDGNQKSRDSVVIERADAKLEEERRKDSNARKTSTGESKKDKEPGLFSSFFGGGKKKGGHESGHKKHASRTISPEPKRELKPDVDYNWTRFSIADERAIYRMAHIKLANPRRELHSQVLLSNFMYSYLAKVQQMHPHMAIPTSAAQGNQRRKEQAEEYSQYQRYQEVGLVDSAPFLSFLRYS